MEGIHAAALPTCSLDADPSTFAPMDSTCIKAADFCEEPSSPELAWDITRARTDAQRTSRVSLKCVRWVVVLKAMYSSRCEKPAFKQYLADTP